MNEYTEVQVGDLFSFKRKTFDKVFFSYCIIVGKYSFDNKDYYHIEWIDDYGKSTYDTYHYQTKYFQRENWRRLS